MTACPWCVIPMDPMLTAAGFDAHPECDPGSDGDDGAAIALVTTMLGGTVTSVEPNSLRLSRRLWVQMMQATDDDQRRRASRRKSGGSPPAAERSFAAQVRDYLADCARAGIADRYHPTAAGAVKMIPHRKGEAALIRAAFDAAPAGLKPEKRPARKRRARRKTAPGAVPESQETE